MFDSRLKERVMRLEYDAEQQAKKSLIFKMRLTNIKKSLEMQFCKWLKDLVLKLQRLQT